MSELGLAGAQIQKSEEKSQPRKVKDFKEKVPEMLLTSMVWHNESWFWVVELHLL